MSANSDFGTWGRYKQIPLDKMTPDQKRIYQLTMKERGQVPGPYKVRLQNPKQIEVMVPLVAYYQGHFSSSKAEIEIGTNLTNGRWWAAYSNYEHEIIAEMEGGLPPLKVQAPIAGLPTSFEDPRQHVVYKLTYTTRGAIADGTSVVARSRCWAMSCRSYVRSLTHRRVDPVLTNPKPTGTAQ